MMIPAPTIRKALTIAGSDSGGGAGIQADLKTFQELGVYGMSAITAVTAQNTLGVHDVHPLDGGAVSAQLHAIGSDLPPDAVKTGMLVDSAVIEAAAACISHYSWRNLVIDPVMTAKGGSSLIRQEAIRTLIESLLPLSTLITPNIPEAEELTEMRIVTLNDREEAIRILRQMGAGSVLLKGGHDSSTQDVVIDMLDDGNGFRFWENKRIDTRHTHGTGCTLSAAITAGLAQGLDLHAAIDLAESFLHAAIAHPLAIGAGHGPTNHFAYRSMKQL